MEPTIYRKLELEIPKKIGTFEVEIQSITLSLYDGNTSLEINQDDECAGKYTVIQFESNKQSFDPGDLVKIGELSDCLCEKIDEFNKVE